MNWLSLAMLFYLIDPYIWRFGSLCQRPQICWLCETWNRRCLSHDHRWNGKRCIWPADSRRERAANQMLGGGSVWWDELCYFWLYDLTQYFFIVKVLKNVIKLSLYLCWLYCYAWQLQFIHIFIIIVSHLFDVIIYNGLFIFTFILFISHKAN